MTIEEKIRFILERVHNGFSFQQQCRHHKIIIEKLHDGSVIAYYADDRDDQSTIDTSVPPFDKLLIY